MIKNFIGTKPETQKRIGLKVSVNPVITRRRFKCHMIVAILSSWYFTNTKFHIKFSLWKRFTLNYIAMLKWPSVKYVWWDIFLCKVQLLTQLNMNKSWFCLKELEVTGKNIYKWIKYTFDLIHWWDMIAYNHCRLGFYLKIINFAELIYLIEILCFLMRSMTPSVFLRKKYLKFWQL